MIESFYLYILSAFSILFASASNKKNLVFFLYMLQTLACLFYVYLYQSSQFSDYLFIILTLSFLESGINYNDQNEKSFLIKMLLNLSFFVLLTEKFSLMGTLTIILTDLSINMGLKQNNGDWLKDTYAIVFRSIMLLFFQFLIILSSGDLDSTIVIENKNLAYLAILFGQVCIYSYLMLFQSSKEFEKKLRNMTTKTGILSPLFIYAGTLFFIMKYFIIILDQLDPFLLTIILSVNTVLFLYFSARSIYQFLIYSGKNFNPYRFVRLILYSFFLIYLTNQASQEILFKHLLFVLISFVLYLSALNYNIYFKNEFMIFSLMGILILPFNPLYSFYEKGFNSDLFEIIIAFSIILISCIMIYSTLNRLAMSNIQSKRDFNQSKLAIIYGLSILGLSII